MKKTITLLLLVVSCVAMANDTIITLSGERIDAKITGVTKDAITYKMPDYLDGPDITIQTSELSSIIFETGQVKTYDHNTTAATKAVSTAINTSTDAQPSNNTVKSYINRSGNTYYYNGRAMSGRVFAHEDYYRFLSNSCPVAAEKFRSGTLTAAAGYGCFISGGAALLIGGIVGIIPGGGNSPELISLYIGCEIVGSAAVLCGIPCTIAGFVKMHKSADIYNVSCAQKQTAAYIDMNVSGNGVGLALHF